MTRNTDSSGGPGMSASDDVRKYEKDGYVKVTNLLPPRSIADLREYVDALEKSATFAAEMDVYHEVSSLDGRRIVRQIENVCSAHPALLRFATEVLGPLAGAMLKEEAVLFKDKINYKHPGGAGYPAHRDGCFWWRNPETGALCRGWEHYASEFISIAVFLDGANTENGCIEIVAGNHSTDAVGDDYGPLSAEDEESMDFRPVVVEAGDILFMNALAPHRSGENRSRNARRVIYFTYNRRREGDHREAYFADKRRSLAAQGGVIANR